MVKTNKLSFEALINSLKKAMEQFPDKRKGKNTRYDLLDAGAGAFSVFFTQSPSFLNHQKMLEKRYGLSNAKTLFGMRNIPTDNHIRDLLDEASPGFLNAVFADCLKSLDRTYLPDFRVNLEEDDLLIALDGTWYFSSEKISCSNCSTKKKDGATTHYHTMINPAIVSPGNSKVIALEPEFVTPQDGDLKQDCENKAAKRWINTHGTKYAKKRVTILGDDLYCCQPMCLELLNHGFNFILICKKDSHKTLYEWLKGITDEKTIRKRIKGKWQTWHYRWAEQVPLKDDKDALEVNWCELTITNKNGRRIYKNAFATNHKITDSNIELIVSAGRTRWKIENENNNTLKTKGYNLKHNYGHGSKNLSSLLATMNILAFLFHTILEFTDKKYQKLRKEIGRRDEFFNHIRTLLQYHCFTSWDRMMWFMTRGLKKGHDPSVILTPI
jgi:hypothetical protein